MGEKLAEVEAWSLTVDQHIAAIRKQPKDGMKNLVAALRSDPALAQESRNRLELYTAMEKANRLEACWISKLTRRTLTVALALVNTQPDVPAGG